MSDLTTADFPAYFQAVHGRSPFPWQMRLLEQVVAEGTWPRLLDLPTGVGKTAAIDVALFHLALDSRSPSRKAPARIVVVVDRRTIVDQTYDRACLIQQRLRDTRGERVLDAMAARLSAPRHAADRGEPLHVAMLRGGMVREDAWARRPDQATIVVSTVDQVGSRLLFRGYGVSESMRPVHAGLLANDALLLLDEVHLSEPFRQTLTALHDRYRTWAERPLESRWQFVEMSATAGSFAEGLPPFRLADEDRAHPVLQRRLTCPKPVSILDPIKVSGAEDSRARKFAEALVEAAIGTSAPSGAIGIVVNRVRTARVVYEAIRRRCGDRARAILLTGRMRPADRAMVQGDLNARVGAGRPERNPDGQATIVVATQCIEAGADLDFDVLVTECASFDALRQRFGRLNRLGEAEACRGAVLIRSDQVDSDDPVYRGALGATWHALRQKGAAVDFGLNSPIPEDLQSCLAPKADAPILLPAHLDTWVQTRPTPDVDPDVALWLRGEERRAPEVQIVWRADLSEALLRAAEHDRTSREDVIDIVEVCPPSALEALTIPLSAAGRWLGNEPENASDFSDVPSAGEQDFDGDRQLARPALRWTGDDSEVITLPAQIRPGDTLIVPADYGGLLFHNWAPDAKEPVSDLGDRLTSVPPRPAAGRSANAGSAAMRPILRLHPMVLRDTFGVEGLPSPPTTRVDADDELGEDWVIADWLERAAACLPDARARETLAFFTKKTNRKIVWLRRTSGSPQDGHYALVSRRKVGATTEDDTSSFTGVAIALDDHLRGVAGWARAFSDAAGFPAEIRDAIELAARWHDLGKADPRFQLLLHGGNKFRAATATALLAKSDLPSGDPVRRRLAAQRSGYPKGARHELLSVALLQSAPEVFSPHPAVDRDLVLHLVASHHGYCRPFAPVALDDEPLSVEYQAEGHAFRASSAHTLERLDSGVSTRFFQLVRRYGWFGLAWMEAVLRLADHRRSEAEQEQGGDQ